MSLRLITRISSKTSLGLGSFNTSSRKFSLFSGNYTAEKAIPTSLCRIISLRRNETGSSSEYGLSDTKLSSCIGRKAEELNQNIESKMCLGSSYLLTKVLAGQPFASSLFAPPLSKPATGLTCLPSPQLIQVTRSITKLSLRKGRRKTAAGVKSRFFRLDWGGWISTQPGRARHLWKKPSAVRHKLKNHIFRHGRENRLLDKMVTKYWVKKKYFVDDPYESYHNRNSFHITKDVKGIQSTKLYKIKRYTIRSPDHNSHKIVRPPYPFNLKNP